MSEENKPTPQSEADKEKELAAKRNAFLRYMTIIFAVAFLLVLISLVLQAHTAKAALSDLKESNSSALSNAAVNAELLQDENRKLQEELDSTKKLLADEQEKAKTQEESIAQLEQELVIDLDESAYENKYCCWQTATITPISFRLDGRYGSSWSSPKTNNAVSITLKDGTSFDLASTENGYADSAYGTYGSMSSSGTGMPEADRVKHTWLFSQLIDLADLASITVDGVTYPIK